MTRACTPGSRLRAIDILIPSTRSTIEEEKVGKKEGRGKHESRGNHASGKMGNDEFLAGVRACFFARRRKNEGKRKRERRADGIEANLGSASFSQRQKNLGKSLMERLSSGGTILVRRSSRVFLAPSNRKATPRGNTRRSEKEREREKGPRLSRSHKTNERIPFFSRVPSRGKGTRRKRRQKENGRQHRFDLTEWGEGGEPCPREIHTAMPRTEGTTDDESSLPLVRSLRKRSSRNRNYERRRLVSFSPPRFFARTFE